MNPVGPDDALPPRPWLLRARQTTLETPVFRLERRHYVFPSGVEHESIYHFTVPQWAVALALTPDHHLVMVQQYRPGIDDFSWEFPAGLVDPGEDPLAGALRELREETGYAGVRAEVLGWGFPNPALQDNRCYYIWVEEAVPVTAPTPEPGEDIATITIPTQEVANWSRSGRLRHALAHQALYFAALAGKLSVTGEVISP